MDLLASDVMTTTVVACVPDTPLEEVVRTLAEHGISGLPVIDVHKKVVGIISEEDLLLSDEMQAPLMKTALYGLYLPSQSVMERMAKARGIRASDVMTKHVTTFEADTPLSVIAHTLHDKHFKRVPIVDAEMKLVGIVSRGDIIRALAKKPA